MIKRKNILIAGGSGFIGRLLKRHFEKDNQVFILTRNATSEHEIAWDINKKEVELERLQNVNIIINLSGASIGSGKWTDERMKLLISSRVDSTCFLVDIANKLPNLEHFISISGIDCYGHIQSKKEFIEDDPFGTNFLANLSMRWEKASEHLNRSIQRTVLRMSVVVDRSDGALPVMSKPVKKGFGAVLGTGEQVINWIDAIEVPLVFEFVLDNKLVGIYNITQGHVTNREFTRGIASSLNKRIFLPRIPRIIIKLILGKMSTIVLDGVAVSNSKLVNAGYQFKTNSLQIVLDKHLQ